MLLILILLVIIILIETILIKILLNILNKKLISIELLTQLIESRFTE